MKKVFFSFQIALCTFGKVYSQPYLFQKFPQLQQAIPHIQLCTLPTPIKRLSKLGDELGCPQLFMKCDHLSGKLVADGTQLYGGNKPRKLEFLLADALRTRVHTVATLGCAGSNHALATAVYAQQLGLSSLLLLKPQPNSPIVRQNLLLDHYYGAQLQFCPTNALRTAAAQQLQQDPALYVIPPGGSTPLGALGFVNAAFELAQQIKEGAMAAPDRIYVATGSCGTVAGLLLGLQAAGINTQLIAVCVEPEEAPDEFLKEIQDLFHATNSLLHTHDATFPLFAFPAHALLIEKRFCGTQYGLFTPEAMDAIQRMHACEGITIEGTYSARPLAAIIDDAPALSDARVLFWNTYCGLDFSAITKALDYKDLPQEFHHYFEDAVHSEITPMLGQQEDHQF